jgi:hypothetical protein
MLVAVRPFPVTRPTKLIVRFAAMADVQPMLINRRC